MEDNRGGGALPRWWILVLLAVLAFVILNWLAQPVATLTGSKGLPSFIAGSMIRGFGLIFQYIIPPALLLLAFFSAQADSRREGIPTEDRVEPTHSPSGEPSIAPNRDPIWGAQSQAIVPTDQWSLDLLKALDWKRFEEVCASYFETLGFRSQLAAPGADGGVDIHLYPQGAVRPAIVVQCKAWNVYQVGVSQVRELFGVMSALKIDEGILATTGAFTSEARRFAQGKNIHLIDGADFLEKLKALSDEHRNALLQRATEGDFTTPTCASCGTKLTARTPKFGGEQFWGCPNFPRCRTTMKMRGVGK